MTKVLPTKFICQLTYCDIPWPASLQSMLKCVGVLHFTPFSTPGPKMCTSAALAGSDTKTRCGLFGVATPP
jgi:hypothetical protein